MGMSIRSAGASAAYQMSGIQQRRQEFQALAQSLQQGNLNGAQQAFSSLFSNASGNSNNGGNGAISQLAQALKSGNVSAAQQAFAALRGHRHHRQDGDQDDTTNVAQQAPSAPPGTGTAVNVMA